MMWKGNHTRVNGAVQCPVTSASGQPFILMNIRLFLKRLNLHAVQQTVKWIIYTILIINFVFYFIDDLETAEHSLRSGGSFLRWTAVFTTTIDELAWFMLLFLFELETYSLSDEAFEGYVGKLIHGVRLVCYGFLAHTIYAYSGDVLSLTGETPLADINNLCQLAGQEISYTYNLVYTLLDQSNCATLSTSSIFYHVDSETLVSDPAGMKISIALAWADLIEAVVWLLIVLLIEFMVRLQGRGISRGPLITMGNYAKPALYGVLVLIAAYWWTLDHWLYVWDEFIWIAGFIAIEMNVVEWRDEIKEESNAGNKETEAAG
jgi:hypothetical protein